MKKISVIVPCYNMSEYLDKSMQSILSQTICEECEIIVIDDGSTDDSYEKMKQYAQNNINIMVLQQTNQGSGIARNNGILKASGRYIAFMDADDFYPSNDILEIMYSKAEEMDAMICGGSQINYFNGNFTYRGGRFGVVVEEEGWVTKEEYPTMAGYATFIYRRDLLIDNHILFPNYLRDQDPPFLVSAIAAAGRVYRIPIAVYAYRKGHKKETFNKRKAMDQIMSRRDLLEIAALNNMYKIYRLAIRELHEACGSLLYTLLRSSSGNEVMEILHDFNRHIAALSPLGIQEIDFFEEDIDSYLIQIRKEKESVLERARNEESVCIYGAGAFGTDIADFLTSNGIQVSCFIVTNVDENRKKNNGISICGAKEYLSSHVNAFVIVGVFDSLMREVVSYMKSFGFDNYYVMQVEHFRLYELICQN